MADWLRCRLLAPRHNAAAGRFHGHGGDAAVPQPGDDGLEAVGVGRELPDVVGRVGGGTDAHPVRCGRDVTASGVAMDEGQRLGVCRRRLGGGWLRLGVAARCGVGVCLPAGFRLGLGRRQLPPGGSGRCGLGGGVSGGVCGTVAWWHARLHKTQEAGPGRRRQAGPAAGTGNGRTARKRSAGKRPGEHSLPHGKRGTARDNLRTAAVTTAEAAQLPSSDSPTGRRGSA